MQIAEHQWIRLTYNSTESHTTTLIRIGMPWKGIMDKRSIVRPFTIMELDFNVISILSDYVDLEMTMI